MPACGVIPELGYPDVAEAVAWLSHVFGFVLRLRIGDHRAQLAVGDGAVAVTRLATEDARRPISDIASSHAVMVRIIDVDRHYEHVRGSGATIAREPEDFPYGERQYTARDLGGHLWTFSETIADVGPETWGAETGPGV